MGALQDDRRFSPAVRQPGSLREAWELKRDLGGAAVYVSGGTLLRTQWEAGTAAVPQVLIDLRKISGLDGLAQEDEGLVLGPLLALAACRKSEILAARGPGVQEAARCIAAPAVRSLATLGGNIASGYGDILPALLVHGAVISSYDGEALSAEPAAAWLDRRWSGGVAAAELVAGISLPAAEPPGELAVFRKVGRREAFTASLVTVALSAGIDTDAGRLSRVRLAAGGGTGRPHRLPAAEALLEGAVLTPELLADVYGAVESSFVTYSDPFASESYKKKTAGNLISAELWRVMAGL